MQVDEGRATATAEHHGRSYYFCSADCQRKFQAEPDRYARQTA
jgi:Cu+-exporting ATPase